MTNDNMVAAHIVAAQTMTKAKISNDSRRAAWPDW